MVYRFTNLKIKAPLVKAAFFAIILSTCCNTQFAYCQVANDSSIINMVFTSDVHYGLTKKQFRGNSKVSSHDVNKAMVQQINSLPGLTLPGDGVDAGRKINAVDYLIEAGDICNRMEDGVQSDAASWGQFERDFIKSLRLKGQNGKPAELLLVPGNHDVSNAIGYSKPMDQKNDPTSMAEIYNKMMHPKKLKTNSSYNYSTDKINYSRNIGGVHWEFITIWPDSAERIWMQKDLDTVPMTTPVVIVTHDPPASDAGHFTNPQPPHKIAKKYQNLLAEYYKEDTAAMGKGNCDIEQRGFVKFLKAHPNIKAYFHGHNNWNEFYVYTGPDNDVKLNTFRVDSPMKGKKSKKDETELSFQVISLNPVAQKLTVRECFWNRTPSDKTQKPVFGPSETISLSVN